MIIAYLEKMKTVEANPVEYFVAAPEGEIPLNPLIGKRLTLEFRGEIQCRHCRVKIKKAFGEGFCFPCFQKLARCDMCIMRPETCHYHLGTCREPEWGEAHCMIPHVVYLANTSEIKVGITREHQKMTRWMDQGAIEALPIRRVKSRYESGLIEAHLKKVVSDRTNWRKMLQGNGGPIDLVQRKTELLAHLSDSVNEKTGETITDDSVYRFTYPVTQYPEKIKSHNLDKDSVLEGTLWGIKGQYLLLDTAVINIRKYSGYRIYLSHG